MSFNNKIWKNQTELGKCYAISAIQFGKYLSKYGLKAGKLATDSAIKDGYAKLTPLKNGTQFYLWNSEKVFALLDKELFHLSKHEMKLLELVEQLVGLIELEKISDKIYYMAWDEIEHDVGHFPIGINNQAALLLHLYKEDNNRFNSLFLIDGKIKSYKEVLHNISRVPTIGVFL